MLVDVIFNLIEERMDGFTCSTEDIGKNLKVNWNLVTVFLSFTTTSCCLIGIFPTEFIDLFVRKNIIISIFIKSTKIDRISNFV